MTGRVFEADEALKLGLVTRIAEVERESSLLTTYWSDSTLSS